MHTIIISRIIQNQRQTQGELKLYSPDKELFQCNTLELPWRSNQRNISRIPCGLYYGVKHQSPKFGNSLWIKDVPDRSEILIHVANFFHDLRGCIAVGEKFMDIDLDGQEDVTDSKNTINKLYNLIDSEFKVIIKDVFINA